MLRLLPAPMAYILGQDDMDVADARRLLGSDAIIGLSIKTMPEAQAAPLQHLTYVAIGAVFPTTSKDNPTHIGAEGFRQIAAEIRARVPGFPVGAIAGITRSQRGRCDRSRRRRNLCDFGIIVGAGSRRGGEADARHRR